jgi:hypothetical protein
MSHQTPPDKVDVISWLAGRSDANNTDRHAVTGAPGEIPGWRTLEPGPSSQLTLCWREPDSNLRFRDRSAAVFKAAVPDDGLTV